MFTTAESATQIYLMLCHIFKDVGVDMPKVLAYDGLLRDVRSHGVCVCVCVLG